MFSYTAFYIMADYDHTRIEIDKDNDGIFESTVYLDQGVPYFVNGGVLAGATARGSQPFQCSLVTGDVGSNYEMRWFELWPDTQWGTDYFSPVATRTNNVGTVVPSLIFLFNPNANAITVTVVTATSTGTVAVAANSVGTPYQMPLNGGARFYTTSGSQFIGVDVFDGLGGCQAYDWGIGLMPLNMMSSMGVIGWGPGQGTTGGGGTTNGNPVWISTMSNTTVYVDYDSNPSTGLLVDSLGNHYDLATNVTALQAVLVVDPNDIDQTGMRFYTLDGNVLMAAWGQDSARAGTGNPFLDMGYAIPAFPTVISRKFATLLTDNNGNGYPDAGDTLEYTVDVINVGFAMATHVIFEDNPPTNLTTYATNSAYSGGSPAPDSLPPKLTRFPFDEGGYDIGTIGLGQTTTVRYVTQIVTNLPVGFDGYIHNNATVGGTNGNWTTGSSTNVLAGGISISKQTSTTNLLQPGTNFTYTITVVNTGAVTYTGINIEDALPLGVTYVSNSALVALSGAQTNTVSDRFDRRAYTNDNGTIQWLTSWQESGEADGVAAGSVQVSADVMSSSVEAYSLSIGWSNRAAIRTANLSGHSSATLNFKYRRVGLDDANDYVDVLISTNNWTTSNQVARLQGAATDTNYLSTNINVSAYISTNTAIQFRSVNAATMLAADLVRFDDVTFTLVGTNTTFAGSAPPVLVGNLDLRPYGTATVTFAVTVDSPPVAVQVVNQARVRADQQLPWLDSNPVTNRINATAGITLQKTSSTTNILAEGSNVTYAILISNTGTVTQTGIWLEDLLPYGMTYSNGTASLFRPFTHTNTFLDLFNSQVHSNSDGNVAWNGLWTEIYDDGNPTSGNISIAVDGGSIPGQTYAVRTVSTSILQRAASLAGYTTATLSFDYRRWTLEAADFMNINVSSNGGTTFTQVGQIGGATNDGSYFTASYDISAYASTGTVIRFGGNASRDATDIVWLDNVRITASAANATNALPDPPDLLVGYVLPPGTTMTVRLTATVDSPVTATSFVNTAQLLSDQQPTWIAARVTNTAAGTLGMKLTKWTALATNWDYGVTNDYYITIENTGTVALAGIKLTDALPAGVTFVSNSAAIVQFLAVTTNPFTETVSDGFGTASYGNNDGTTNWLGNWAEVGDDNSPTTGSELIRAAGGTNALVFELTNADNDFVTRTNPLAALFGRVYTNVTLSFSYRREGWDANDSMTFYISTNGFASQSNLIYTVPSQVITDAAYSNFLFNVSSSMGAQMALRIRAGPNFAAGDRFNLDFVTFTNQGYDVATNVVPNYSSNVVVSVVSNLTTGPTNLLVGYTLAPGTSLSVRVRATLDVPLVSTQFVNTATTTNAQTPPTSATVTNFSVANAVGNFVWSDANGNGIQNGGEVGLTGVTVRVYSSDSNLLMTTTSGVAGAYSFTNLPTGSYFLEFTTPSNYLATLQDLGGDDSLDSDISTNTGRTAAFTLSGGTNDTTRDAGYYQPPSSIGNFTWRDVNGNGIQNGGTETGLVGVVVRLYDASSNVVGVTTSSAAGAYSFTNLPAANYFLGFTAPTNFTLTLQDQGGDDTVDSDASPITGYTALFNLPPGTNDTSWDAGFSVITYGLRLTKTTSASSCLGPGDTNTYTITVANTGNVSQVGIALVDVLPAGLTYVSNSVSAVFAGVPTTVVYNASTTFTVPAGVTGITVQAWGGGGGGAQRTSNGAGGGGGGGASSRSVLTVIPGSNYTVTVGGGGAQNTTGGDSWFALGTVTSVLAKAGTGGTLNITNGAAGGAAASGIGAVLYNGGNGANGVTATYGGGGGSSAGTNAAGTSATVAAGAVAPAGGGNGGAGKTAPEGAGTAGSAPGGGGGGALRTANNQNGGAGATGRIAITYDLPQPGTLGAPPNLWTSGTLATGASVIVTFKATVDSPSLVTQLLNTASAYSAVQPALFSSVTNCVKTADIGVQKSVTTTTPDMVQIIEYIVVATNKGPDAATGVKITDVLPSQVQYNSHSNGTYSSASGIWDIGTLGVGASTTLYINVTVRENTGGLRITNTATVTARDLYDSVSSNDTSSVVIVPKGAVLGDYTWVDSNGNGQQDGGETGLSNVVVTLYNAASNVIGITTSSVAGAYAFTNLPPGSYFLVFAPSAGYLFTTNDVGADATDSDVLPGTNRTALVTLTGSQTNLTVDAGFYAPATLGDYTWDDYNANGQQDGGEPGLSNVVVTLYNAASNVIGVKTSSAAGAYSFTNLPPGSYFLGFALPAGYQRTLQDQGNDATDSDAHPTTGLTGLITLTSGLANNTVDAGFFRASGYTLTKTRTSANPAFTGDAVTFQLTVANTGSVALATVPVVDTYETSYLTYVSSVPASADNVNDGTLNWANIGPLAAGASTSIVATFTAAGATVTVKTNKVVASPTVTNGPAVSPKTNTAPYDVAATGFTLTKTRTTPASGPAWAGSNVVFTISVVNTGAATLVTIPVADTYETNYLAYVSSVPASADNVNDGTLNWANIGPLAAGASTSIVATFTAAAPTVAAKTNQAVASPTATNGPALAPQTNRAPYEVNNSGYTLTKTRTSANPAFIGDAVTFQLTVANTGSVALVTVPVVDTYETSYLTYASSVPASADNVNDGTLNWANIGPLAAGASTSIVATFTAAAPTVTAKTNQAVATPATAATNPPVGPKTNTAPYQVDPFATLGDFVWEDLDANGIQDAGEPGISNVVVTLYNTNGVVAGVTTSSVAGAYSFTNVVPGYYTVGFALPAGYQYTTNDVGSDATDSDVNPATGRTGGYTLTSGQTTNTVDAGFYRPATIGDYTWVDANGNGQQDGGETGLSNVVVTLYNAASNMVGVKTSSVAGAYGFTNLPPGGYFLAFAPPSGYLFTTSKVGAAATDSDVLAGTNRTAVVTVTSGQVDNTVDAGFYLPATIGDRVWFDANLDGIQNAGETNGITNLVVALMDVASNVVASTTTSAGGVYLFTNVVPGSYYVRFDLNPLIAYSWITTPKASTNDTVDSDATRIDTNNYAWTGSFTLSNSQTNRNVDLGIRPQKSTRAEVAEVWGEWRDGEGRMVWRTSSEWNTAGFFVYRVDPETGEETRLNDILLPSAFEPAGSIYGLADPQVREGGAGAYRLEEMELSGGVLDMGEHNVVFVPPRPAPKAAKAAATIKFSTMKLAGPSSALKVMVKNEGLYGVSLQSIADGMGRSLESVQALALAGSLKITSMGVPVPAITDEARGRLVFHGQGTRNWYTRDAAYLISAGEGMAMSRREPAATGGETAFPVQVRFEQDRYPFDTATQMPEDFYYWEYVISGNATMGSRNFSLDLTGRTGDVALKVRLMGWSSTTNDPDHLAEFSFNGAVVGSATFDGQDAIEAELTIPAAWVSNGLNTLTVKGVLQPGRSFSYFVVDRIDASFDRELAPLVSGAAHFRAGEAAAVSAQAFTAPLAVAVDEAGNPIWIADAEGKLPAKAWAVAAENERFAVIEADAVPLLEPEPAAADAWFMSKSNRIDYLVIASRELASAAQELADYRSGQGLRTGVAVFEDVCDLLAGGLRTPEAIPELLAYAQASWVKSPRMVVLAGNGHYDYLGALSNEVNHLPPMMLQTQDGLFAADGLLADTGSDGLPDVALGRLPALTATELTAMIAKIKAYEGGFGQAWQNQLVLASDTNDAAAGNFSAANLALAARAGNRYPVARIDLDTMAINPARASLTNWFKAGAGIIHYTGHGGVANWSAKNLLKAADVNSMTNARKPVVVALSCLVGRYEAPAVDSLGELLMRRAQGGAVSVWGPSGLSRNSPATELGEAFYRAVLQEGSGTLGLAILQARRRLQGDLFSRDTFAIYNLLGDPALRIAGNETSSEAKSPAQIFLLNLDQVYDGTARTVAAMTEPAGLEVEFTYDGDIAAPRSAGRYAVTGTLNDPDYEGSASGTLTIDKAGQTIDFPAIGDKITTDAIGLAATASSGLSVSFAVGSGPASISGGTNLSFTGAGSVSIVASQSGDGNWNAAPAVTRTFHVAPPAPHPVFSRTNVNVRENGEGRFFVRLNIAPAGSIAVGISRSAGSTNLAVKGASALTFGPANWSTWQVVTLAAANDANADNETATFRISAPGGEDGFVMAASLDDDIGANLALASAGSTIVGTKNSSTKPEYLTDGVHTSSASYGYTFWTNIPPGTMTLDLKAATTVSRIRLLNWDWSYRTHQYRIETSLNGADWTTVVNATTSEQRGWEDWPVANELARYLRFTGITNSVNPYVCIAELEVYGAAIPLPQAEVSTDNVNVREAGEGRFYVRLDREPPGNVMVGVSRFSGDASLSVKNGATLTFTPSNWSTWQGVTLEAGADANAGNETATFRLAGTGLQTGYLAATALDDDIGENLALASGGATISGTQATKPEWLIDGLHLSSASYGYTFWTNDPPGTMTLDLKAATTVSRIRLLNWDWGYRTHRYRIESSLDGASWTTVVDAATSQQRGWDDWAVAGESIRYLRFTGVSNSANRYVCIAEWEVYGERTPMGRKGLALAKAASAAMESDPVTVVTSYDGPEHTNGWGAVDGDLETMWEGKPGARGWHIAVGYGSTLLVTNLVLDLAEGSLTNVQCLYSLDAVDWLPLPEDLEKNPVSLNFLWLVFPDDGTEAAPQVLEIRPNPEAI